MLIAAGGEGRPDIIAGRNGELVAVRGDNGRLAALGTRSGSFELSRWLEHDGDGRAARDVLKGRAFRCDGTGCATATKGLRVAVARHPAAIAEDYNARAIPRSGAGSARARALLARIARDELQQTHEQPYGDDDDRSEGEILDGCLNPAEPEVVKSLNEPGDALEKVARIIARRLERNAGNDRDDNETQGNRERIAAKKPFHMVLPERCARTSKLDAFVG
jgi:hypothetical protein